MQIRWGEQAMRVCGGLECVFMSVCVCVISHGNGFKEILLTPLIRTYIPVRVYLLVCTCDRIRFHKCEHKL